MRVRSRYVSVCSILGSYYSALWMSTVLVWVLCVSGIAASSAQAQILCPNEQLRTEQAYGLGLPDCRAFEMVSPLNKNDNDVLFVDSRASVSDEAPAIAYFSPGSFAESPSEPRSALVDDRYISRRGPGGWSTKNISPPYISLGGDTLPAFKESLFTPDLSEGLVESTFTPLVGGEPEGYINLYMADTGSSTYRTVTTTQPPGLKPYTSNLNGAQLSAAGASTDLSRVVFQEIGNLTGVSEVSSNGHVYEWVNGALSLVDVPPVGAKLEAEDGVGALGHFGNPESGDEWHAVSADGSRVFFTGGEGKGEEAQGQLYVREVDEARTVEVSASQRESGDPNDHAEPTGEDPDGLRPARYWAASADGSKVFFTSRAELTDNANTGPADNTENLYEYDLEDGALTDLSVDKDVEGAAVLGVVTASEDGSYVYFVAEGVLTAEGNAEGEMPEADKPNLYLYNGGKVVFIATLAPATFHEGIGPGVNEEGGDSNDWRGEQREHFPSGAPRNFGPEHHTVRVTPGGVQLAFESERGLTGYNNEQAEPGECDGQVGTNVKENGRCREVYLYDAAAGGLMCVSCDRGGAQPVGPAELGGHEEEAGSAEVFPSPFYVPRNFSEDGDRLFFQSPDALVPQDSNGRTDVYEWESRGVGSCVDVDGCVYPVSNVAGGYESRFMDASPSGDNVFIATKDQLVASADGDSRVNVYDARVGGGVPVLPSSPVCTNADSCKPPASLEPSIFGAPATATFSGVGNLAAMPVTRVVVKRCKRGLTRRRGKCIRSSAKRTGKRGKGAGKRASHRGR